MTDRATLCMAVCAAVGAWLACGPSPLLGGAVLILALASQWPWLMCVAVALLASGLAVRAHEGLHPPPLGPYAGTVTLLSDPEPFGDSLRVDLRARGNRLEAWIDADSDAADVIHDRLAGERVTLQGTIERSPPGAEWLEARHIVGRMSVTSVTAWSKGAPVTQLGNGLRRTLERGAEVMSERHRGLFLGFVLGDDRGQSPEVADDFRGAGLTHLLAVSGQNVAFVLALAGPLLRRLAFSSRLPAALAIIGFFALVTRFEPSVLRASVMAGIAALAAALGREASGIRCLALAATGLILIDPLLVQSVGFQLSAAASAGILILSRPIAARLPGPRPLVEALAVTLAAQLAVAPILVMTFGGIPLASIPANLLAAPAAGPVMAWGLAGGIVAGVAGQMTATIIHFPTELLIGWLAFVARWAAQLPLGELGPKEIVVLTLATAAAVAASKWSRPALARAAVVLAVAALIAPAVARRSEPSLLSTPAAGGELWRASGSSVLLLGERVRTDDLLEGLRRAGASQLDLVVVKTADRRTAEAAGALSSTMIVAPAAARIEGARTIEHPTTLAFEGLTVRLEATSGEIHAVVYPVRPTGPSVPSARGPPSRFQRRGA